jgi:hypothetical protein
LLEEEEGGCQDGEQLAAGGRRAPAAKGRSGHG